MADSDKAFTGSLPKFYDTLMVPLIFEAYAAHLAALVARHDKGPVTGKIQAHVSVAAR